MLSNPQEFFELLKYSNELLKKDTSLKKENRQKYRKLVDFNAKITENLHLKQKERYIQLMENFLNNTIDAKDFSFCFIAQYHIPHLVAYEMIQDFEKNVDELSHLLTDNPHLEYKFIGQSIMFLSEQCDEYISSIIDEANLRNSAKSLLSELKRT